MLGTRTAQVLRRSQTQSQRYTSIQTAGQMDELFEIDAQARKQGLKEDRQLVKKQNAVGEVQAAA